MTRPAHDRDDQPRITKADDPGKGPDGIVPDLVARVVVGIFDRLEQADAAVREVHRAGYAAEEVSLVLQPPGTPPEVGTGATKAEQGAVVGASAGTVLGGIAALAALAIPGVGPLLAAGPIAAVISGALVGGTLGGLVGSFTGLGIPTERAQEYEATVRKGGIVVVINVPDRSADDQVTSLLRRHGAREVASYTQAL